MTDNSLNISIPIKFEIRTPPRGMTDYDPKALSAEQQNELNSYKLSLRKDIVLYLMEHPEIKAVVALVLRTTMIHQPRNIVEFIAEVFSRPEQEIRRDVNAILNETQIEYDTIPHLDYEDWDW